MIKRLHHRHRKRLETVFSAEGLTQRGITSDVSEGGLFIRTRYGFVPESVLDIEIHLPDGRVARLKGRVKRSLRTQITTLRNGMGVEILEKDLNYTNLLRLMEGGEELKDAPSSQSGYGYTQMPEYLIITCSGCRAKNKLPGAKLSFNPKCGKCGTILRPEDIV